MKVEDEKVMKLLDNLNKFVTNKVVPVLKDASMPIAKSIFCKITSTEKKKELVIKKVRDMSEEELDEIMRKNHPLGFIGVHIYSREVKLEKIIDAVNKMDDSEINEIIMNS
jgi:hypothetical protein